MRLLLEPSLTVGLLFRRTYDWVRHSNDWLEACADFGLHNPEELNVSAQPVQLLLEFNLVPVATQWAEYI